MSEHTQDQPTGPEEDSVEDLTAEQLAEIDRRVAAYRRDKDPGQSWRDALAEIRES